MTPRELTSRLGSRIRKALGAPLFWKILGANAGAVGAATILGGILGARFAVMDASPTDAVVQLAATGVLLTLFVNALILRLALKPLVSLEEAAARVQQGNWKARAPHSQLFDPAMRRLAHTFNAALDSVDASRRRVRVLLTRSIEADERERGRVAEMLDNEIGQRLAGILLRLKVAERAEGAELTELVEDAREQIARAVEIVAGYARERRSAVLEELGLVPALQAEARRIMAASDLVIRVEGDEDILPAGEALALYRAAREAIDNAAHHSWARQIRVRVARTEDSALVAVEDDGLGFDLASSEGGLGLLVMRERIESLGGRATIWSGHGGGTRVRLEVPIRGGNGADPHGQSPPSRE
jgi:two-component system sensor histidine kinase UhpB